MFMPILPHSYLFILMIVCQQVIVNSVERTLSYENKDVFKLKLDPTHHQLSDFFNLGHTLGLRTVTSKKDRTLNNSITKSPNYKKWQVGRVSRKQYEIINMLWRKTKEFRDVEISTVNYHTSDPLFRVPPRIKSTSSTSSFIEFYYLDEDNNQNHNLFKDKRSQQYGNVDKMNKETADYPNFAFRINNPNYVRLTVPTKQCHTKDILTQQTQQLSLPINAFPHYGPLLKLNNEFLSKIAFANKSERAISKYFKSNGVTVIESFINNETWPVTDTFVASDDEITNLNTMTPKISTKPKLTTLYDRIKFFEIYDKNTPLSSYDEGEKSIDLDDVEKSINSKKLSYDLKIISDHVNQNNLNENNGTYKVKHAKKRIIENNLSTEDYKMISTRIFNSTTRKKNISCRSLKEFPSAPNFTEFSVSAISTVATWSDYSFMAVYVYEPSQVYCDAAGISPHWLVTSGSCLSRRHNNPRSGGRSAFIAYCGSSWWSPDRVAYVKYSVVHPRYRQREKLRKYLYNIGLIEVVISMVTCPSWAPVSMMSHQFPGYAEGSKAYAVGWGLDRYDTRYSATELPKYPLMAYESKVFSNSCPGDTQLESLTDDEGMKNLYCLLLPPYAGEETDPIHGSMLLIEGKLCAIYLQEERRTTGNQSAQYTGIWRLGPWVSEMAREPEDAETFSFGK